MIARIFVLVFLQVASLAYAQEYKYLNRTYVDLASLSLNECQQQFRFLNNNWMDCNQTIPLPGQADGVAQITMAQYPQRNFTFTVPGTDMVLNLDVRFSGETYDKRAFASYLWVSAYYRNPNGSIGRIEYIPKEFYTYEIFSTYLKKALEKISQEKTWKTESPIIAIPGTIQEGVEDQVLDSIYVVRRKIYPKLAECQQNWVQTEVDAWPDPDYWMSSCNVSLNARNTGIPLGFDQWDATLKSALPPVFGDGNTSLSYSWNGYSIFTYGKVTFEEMKQDIEDVLKQSGPELSTYFIVRESQLKWKTRFGDEVLGKLVRKNGKMSIGAK